MPSQAVIEFLSSPDIINVVNHVVVSPDIYCANETKCSSYIDILTLICLFLQAIIMFWQWWLSRTIYRNNTFEDKNNYSRDDLSTILFESYAFIEQLNTEITQAQGNQKKWNELVQYFSSVAGKVKGRIISFQGNFGKQLRDDVYESIESLRKAYFEFEKYCLAFKKAEQFEENIKLEHQDMLKNDLQTQQDVLEARTNDLSEITQNKRYLIKH